MRTNSRELWWLLHPQEFYLAKDGDLTQKGPIKLRVSIGNYYSTLCNFLKYSNKHDNLRFSNVMGGFHKEIKITWENKYGLLGDTTCNNIFWHISMQSKCFVFLTGNRLWQMKHMFVNLLAAISKRLKKNANA